MQRNNILITSAGKRVELLLEFQRELQSSLPGSKVLAVDLNPEMAAACHLADMAFAVPRVTADNYIDILFEICLKNNVGIVVPTIDTELKVLADNRKIFSENGIEIMISSPEFISICRDKRLTTDTFKELNIRAPKAYDKYNPHFPMFAKPYDGSLSTNIHLLKTIGDLTPEILNDPKLMFMEYIDKNEYKEFTVDMYYGADGFVKSIVPRERIEIRSGEVNKGATRKNHIVEYLKSRMNHMPQIRGCICIQIFYREQDNDIVGIEINPRYGGGYPLSYYSGANFPKMMIDEYLLRKSIEYSVDWQDNTIMLRYDSQVIVS